MYDDFHQQRTMANAAGEVEVGVLVHDDVKDYYGKRVKKSDDLVTNCCTVDRNTFSSEVKEALKQIHEEVLSKNYGCGAVYPEAVLGCQVLDLGSGAGLDCFVLSKLVGPDGHVTGVDMTQEQLEVSRRHIDYHMRVFGYSAPNVEFRQGYIEKLRDVGIADESVDVMVSNCVVNLSPDKKAVLQEAYRVLKMGGEFYFSDIYCSRPIPEAIRKDKVLWGECLAGALEWRELIRIAMEIGFAPPVLVTSVLYKCSDPEIKAMLNGPGCENLKFCSATYRLMKVATSGPGGSEEEVQNGTKSSEEKLVPIRYKGTISGHEASLKLSCHSPLTAGTIILVPESISGLLKCSSRLSNHIDFSADSSMDGSSYPVSDIPPLATFSDLNPFEFTSRSVELGAPKTTSTACCGEENKGETDKEASICCSGDAECPPAKRSCCGADQTGKSEGDVTQLPP